ncbi:MULTISPECIES: M16 family metallopeptidase [Ramlibacter]|uniref:Insulinase family protein n=1 Tax=Ramlibacter pinisoli TaxID=2682844 RepID=A0A6N8J1L0_9BURK|nr:MULTISPECIES: pitrilysin family protein [Ramlibacter]MBA2962113.1 insulinase family protein [Ramlibacter sp. CGMCC 1.13660]MVQ32056.1 insulinase family protein [Ramlibacter pinisoli]
MVHDTAAGTPVLRTLANGVRLLAIPMPHVRSASIGVFLHVGSRDETPATNGIGHVLEHMAFKGTTTRSVQAINLDAERLGADVNAFTGKDTTGYFMTGLGRHAEQLLRMTADIVLNSTFPEAELQRELEVIRQEAIEYEEDPQESSSDLLDRAIWGDDPMGMPVIGTVANIERFSRQDLVGHVQAHYAADKTVVAAAGNFDVAAWLALAAELFAAMPASAARADARPVVPATYVGHALGRRFTQVSQVFLNMAYPLAPAAQDQLPQQRWRLAASLAANLFGGGMSAPLVDTVREQLGLAYTAHSTVDSGDAWANFVVQAVTTPDKLDALVTATGRLLRAQAGAIDPVHLERAKNQLTVSRVRAGERTYATMEQAVEELFASGTVTSIPQALALIDDIDADEVRAVFERMLANPIALAITGKGASARGARQLVASLAAADR